MSPNFLSIEHALAIHAAMIERYGGSSGVRDLGGLESALAQAQVSFGGEFLLRDVFEMAAAYLFHVTQNHPFIDGNKRVGASSAVVFLGMNGYDLAPSANDELEAITMLVAQGKADKPAIADFLRKNC